MKAESMIAYEDLNNPNMPCYYGDTPYWLSKFTTKHDIRVIDEPCFTPLVDGRDYAMMNGGAM